MRRSLASWRRPLLAGILLVIVSVVATWVVAEIQSSGRASSRRMAERAGLQALRRSVNEVLLHERQLAATLAVLHSPIGSGFPVFARVVTDDSAAHGVGLIVPLLEGQRAAFEREHGVRVVAVPRPGVMRPAPHRGVHWVVLATVQRPGSGPAGVGVDLSSNPLRRNLLIASARTGAQLATPPVRFLSQPGGGGVNVYMAIRHRDRLLGWLSATYTPDRLVAALRSEMPGLRMSIRDARSPLVTDTAVAAGSTTVLSVAGRRWLVRDRVPPVGDSVVPWLVLAIGLLITAAVVFLMRAGAAREQYALALVSEHVAVERERQAELEAQRRSLTEAQAIASVGSWWWKTESDTAEWSGEMYRIFGRDPARGPATGDAFFAYLHPDDREQIAAGYAEAFGGEGRFELDYRIVREDGEVRHLHGLGRREPDGRYVGTVQDVTALRLAQVEAQTQRELARQIVDTAHEAFVSCDSEGRVVAWNPAAEKLFGWSPEEAVGRTVAELVVPEALRDRHREGIHRLVRTGETRILGSPVLLPARHRSGRELAVEMTIAQLEIDGDRAFNALIRDVSERQQRDHERALLAAIVEQSADAIIAHSEDGLITEWNRGAERLYGYPAAEAVGQPVSMLVPPERAEEEQRLLAHTLGGEAVPHFETLRLRRDGTRVAVSISVSPLRDGDGRPAGASVVAHDITARVREQAERRAVEERLRVTVDHAPIGVAMVSLDEAPPGRILSANPGCLRLWGDEDPVKARVWLTDTVDAEDTETLRDDLERLSTGRTDRIEREVRCLHPDGHITWVLLTGSAVPGTAGAPARAIFHALDIDERKRFEGQLQHLADHDALTGLPNRRRFIVELERAVAHSERYGSRGAVLMIDLDGFKHVNDTMGHSYGDELISRVARLLNGAVRRTDVVARLGGDEFAVIASESTEEQGLAVADKLLGELGTRAIVLDGSRHATVTASIGLTTFSPSSALTAEELLVEADIAMYQAKASGKNQTSVYRSAPVESPPRVARRSWLERLQTAIEEHQFELLAQPIQGICSAGANRYELLLRLRSDDGDLIPPRTFLLNAERFELIQRIDRWVFSEALRLLRLHHAAGEDISLSVNMSGKTLSDPTILTDIRTMISRCPIPRDRLVVEVTETAAIVNIDEARTVARGLRELGCQFALDDFGAGFASFYYLKHLDFDYLKIDGEFVKAVTLNNTDQLVIESVVAIARGLGAKTIAEFVGDDATVRCLRRLGIDYGQGYHLGRPAPLAELLPAASATV